MTSLRLESTRGGLVESVHRVHVAVTDADGRLLAGAGDPDLVTFWRSAAKPFQAIPLVADGAADRFGFGRRELALACASHSSEPIHLAVADAMLLASGSPEDALACGPHAPLGGARAEQVLREGLRLSPRWSNCSGKHAGMLALARHHGWPVEGYERAGHPVQDRILAEVSRWTGVPVERIALGVDGCTVVCFGLPLSAMATAYARLACSTEPAAARIREAMLAHPELIGGAGRPCTELMEAWPGELIAKIGAEGVYSAALVHAGIGIAIKMEDGDGRSSPVALVAVLAEVLDRLAPGLRDRCPLDRVARWAELPIRNTRGAVTGAIRPAGGLRFGAEARGKPVPAHTSNGVG